MIKNSPLASCASVSYMQVFYAHVIFGYFCILKRVCQLLPFSNTQEGEPGSRVFCCFCILNRVNHVLEFLLPHSTVFQYLRQHTYVGSLVYYMISWQVKRYLTKQNSQRLWLSCILPGNDPFFTMVSHFWSKPLYPAHFTQNYPLCPTGLDFCLFNHLPNITRDLGWWQVTAQPEHTEHQ